MIPAIRKFAFLVLVLFLVPLLSAASSGLGKVRVKVENLRNKGQGTLYVAIFDRASGTKGGRFVFNNINQANYLKKMSVTSGTMTVELDRIPHGDYVVLAYHDMNGKGKLQSNFIGIPTEDMAISNNVKGGPMGGPKWEIAKVTLDANYLELKPLKMVHLYR